MKTHGLCQQVDDRVDFEYDLLEPNFVGYVGVKQRYKNQIIKSIILTFIRKNPFKIYSRDLFALIHSIILITIN